MKTQKILAIAFLILSVILAVVSFILLPETVTTQLGTNPTSMPKLPAVLIPTALGCGFSLAFLLGKKEEKVQNKYLLVSSAGVLVFVIMLIVNL